MELSSLSQQSCDAIYAVLSKHYTHVGVSVVNSRSDLDALVASRPDLVFLGMEFLPQHPILGLVDSDKIWLAEYLDEQGIAYTGSDQYAHQLARNKSLAKQRMLEVGIRTPKFTIIKRGQPLQISDITLAYPLFAKPMSRGGGLGIDDASVVHNFEELLGKVSEIDISLQSDVLVEEYLPGREFSVAILKKEDSTDVALLPLELVAPRDKRGIRMLSGKVKSSNAEQIVRVTDPILKTKVTNLAKNVFQALGAQDYARIDIRLDGFGTPNFLEANLMPSLISGYGSFPKACVLNIGLDYEPMILKIVRLGLCRSNNIINTASRIASEPTMAFTPIERALGTV